jgi:hypothetical protein
VGETTTSKRKKGKEVSLHFFDFAILDGAHSFFDFLSKGSTTN